MEASPQIAREYNIPREVVDAAYRKNPIHRARMHEASTKLFGLCDPGTYARRVCPASNPRRGPKKLPSLHQDDDDLRSGGI